MIFYFPQNVRLKLIKIESFVKLFPLYVVSTLLSKKSKSSFQLLKEKAGQESLDNSRRKLLRCLRIDASWVDALSLSSSASALDVALVNRDLQHRVQVCLHFIRVYCAGCGNSCSNVWILVLLILSAAATSLHLCRLSTTDICVQVGQWFDNVSDLKIKLLKYRT